MSDNRRRQAAKRGFTLVEVIVTMALLAIVISSAFMLLDFGTNAFAKGVDEYDSQASMRLAMEKTNGYVRNATAVFTIPQSTFESGVLSSYWNYFGTRKVEVVPANGTTPAVYGSQIINYVYNPTTNSHDEAVVLEAQANRFVAFEFSDATGSSVMPDIDWSSGSRVLKLVIKTYSPDRVNEYGQIIYETVMETMLEASNSMQVVDLGTVQNPATAFAYRDDERPDVVTSKPVVANVAFIMDTSGSMDNGLDGEPVANSDDKRISLLKNASIDLVEDFGLYENVNVALVKFATKAYNTISFLNAKSDSSELVTRINSISANGGTNTGDALRRAYYALVNNTPAEDVILKNYIILLVDGKTTHYSTTGNSGAAFYTGDGNEVDDSKAHYSIRYNTITGEEIVYNTRCDAYLDEIGNLVDGYSNMRVFLVGFSSGVNQDALKNIADASGINYFDLDNNGVMDDTDEDDVFYASDYSELLESFELITESINDELWHLMGPQLQ